MSGRNGAKGAVADTKRASAAARDALRDAAEALPDLAKRAEDVLRHRARKLKGPSRDATAAANEQLETARAYVVERVQERPFTTTLAVLGAGVLLGLLFAGRRR